MQNFSKSLDCLLSSESENQDKKKKREKHIYELLFQKDCNGATPFSHAIKHWKKETIFKLLAIGAGLSKQDMKLIPPTILEEFLNEHCVSKMEEENVVLFKYSFLQRKSMKKLMWHEKHFEKTSKQQNGSNPNLFERIAQKIRGSDPNLVGFEEDVDVLHQIIQSNQHRYLVTHPVIRTFLWIKWVQMYLPLERYRLAFFMFLFSLVWFSFDLFGGKQWKANGRSGAIINTMENTFCHQNNKSLASNILNESFALTTDNMNFPNGLTFGQCFAEYGFLYACFILTSAL